MLANSQHSFIGLIGRPAVALAALVLLVSGCGTTDEDTSEGDEQSVSFDVDGDQAFMVGVIDGSTPAAVEALLDDHPEVETVVLVDVPGSADDAANLEAARLIRQAAIATHVPADGAVASGGVDFFLAGAARSYEDGAEFAVHSWATGDGVEGADVPRSDPEHDLYLDYYDEMGVPADFYWFTLAAAPAQGLHIMTAEELARYRFGTLVEQ